MARALDGEAPMWNKGLASLGLLLLAVVVYAAVPTHGQNSGPPGRPAVPLPEGEGKATVQAACGICHSLRQVTNAGYDRAEWDTVLHMMVNVGAPLPPGKFDTVLNYLAAKFPPKPAPAAKLIPGPARVTITEWVVPTPGSRRTIRCTRRTGRCGIRARWRTCWGGSIPARRRSRSTRSRRGR